MKNNRVDNEALKNCEVMMSKLVLAKCVSNFLRIFTRDILFFSLLTALVVAIEISYRFGTSGRELLYYILTILLLFIIIVTIISAIKTIRNYLYRKRDVISEIDSGFKHLRILMLFDLIRMPQKNCMVKAAAEEICLQYRSQNRSPGFFGARSMKDEYKRIILAVVLFSFVLFFNPANSAFSRILNYESDFTLPPSHQLTMSVKELLIPESDTLEISCNGSGVVPEMLNFKKILSETGTETSIIVSNTGNGKFVFSEPASKNFICYFESEETRSDTCKVLVLKRPYVEQLNAKLKPPAYTKLDEKEYNRSFTQITGYKGSILDLDLKTDPLGADSVRIVFREGESILMDKVSESEYFSSITLNSGSDFYFLLYRNFSDEIVLTNLSPVVHKLDVLNDEYPFVNLIYPEEGMLLKEDMNIPVFATGTDDFEIKRIQLHMRKISFNRFTGKNTESAYTVKTLENAGEKDGISVVNSYVSCSELNLLPEDKVELFLRVYDNDNISGPKYSDSKVRTVVLPSLEQLLNSTGENYEEQDKTIRSELERSKDILKTVEEISEKLKRNQDLNWEDKNKLDQILKEQEKMNRNLQDLETEIDKNISMLDENSVLSDETMKKYIKLQQLVDEIFSKEIKDKLQNLSELSNDEKFDKKTYSELIKDFEQNQQKFKNDLEKSIEILEQIKNEYILDKLIRQLDTMISDQNEVNSALNSKEISRQETVRKEEYIESSFEFFRDELEKSSESMKLSGMDSVQKKSEEQNIEKDFAEIKDQMSSSDLSKAKKTGSTISSKLLELKDDISSIKKKMMDEQKEELQNEINSVIADLIAVSEELELIKNFSIDIPSDSGHAPRLIRDYARIGSSLEAAAVKIFEISKRTFFIDKMVIAQVGRIEELYQTTSLIFNNRQFRFTYDRNVGLMGNINTLAVLLEEAVEDMESADSPSGLEEMLKKMEELARKQAQLNKNTSQAMSSSQGTGMTQMQEMMNRLAQEQAQLYDALMKMQSGMKSPGEQGEPGSEGAPGDGIEGQQGNAGSGSPGDSGARGNSGNPVAGQNGDFSGEGSGLGKRLGNISSDMKEIEDQLRDKKLDESLLSKQDQVLDKLLDAVESMKREKLDNKRESRSGSKIAVDPGNIKIDGDNNLKEMLIRTLKDGYSNEYKIKIKKYFRELEN
ncbi:MAG: hypothetical protein WC212_02325 [Candidatus Delongbacteria bacterium]